MIRRITCAVGAALSVAVASLALAGSALAAPSTPTLTPLPLYLLPDQQISWAASTLDVDGVPGLSAYEFKLFDITKALGKLAIDPGGYNPNDFTSYTYRRYTLPPTATLNVLFPNVIVGDEYLLCVRTDEVTAGYGVKLSGWSCDTFVAAYLFVFPRLIVDKYISINPDPGCIQCGLADFVSNDPETIRAISSAVVRDPTPITGLRIDARGDVAVVYG
jgi:hypothetical protein